MAQSEYKDYLSQSLGTYTSRMFKSSFPSEDTIRKLLERGADINSYFLNKDRDLPRSKNINDTYETTLLYTLVFKLKSLGGKKFDKLYDLLRFVLNQPDVNPNIGLRVYSYTKPRVLIDTPLAFAVNNRMPNIIKLLVENGAIVTEDLKQKWKSYSESARSESEVEKLETVGKLLGINYKPQIEARKIPYNAINTITRSDIEDGNILVDINKEYNHGYYYLKDSWNQYEKSKPYGVTSPITRKPIESKVVYKAEVMGPVQQKENFEAIQTNLFEGGRKKTRKLKSKRRGKTSKWTR